MKPRDEIAALLVQAGVQQRLGNHRGAIALVERAIGIDPNRARSHAVLASLLLSTNRVRDAKREILIALQIDVNDPELHLVAAAVFAAQHKLKQAWAHVDYVLAGPSSADAFVLAASLHSRKRDRTQAREMLSKALMLEPQHVGAMSRLAQLELDSNNRAEARRLVKQALRNNPESFEAHVAAGHIDLDANDVDSAADHGRAALRRNPTDHRALFLWTAIQARRSRSLGLWWRVNVWMSRRRPLVRYGVALGSVAAAQLAIRWLRHDHPDAAGLLGLVCFIMFAYLIGSRAVFDRMLRRALTPVKLVRKF